MAITERASTGENSGGAHLLTSDLRVAYLLIDEARYRSVARLLGVDREGSSLVTIVALGLLATAARNAARKLVGVPDSASAADPAIAVAVAREAVRGLGGAALAGAPYFATLVVLAVARSSLRPALGASSRGVRSASHWARTGFDHRYGHLFRPSRA
jgi:hypothetical protein